MINALELQCWSVENMSQINCLIVSDTSF